MSSGKHVVCTAAGPNNRLQRIASIEYFAFSSDKVLVKYVVRVDKRNGRLKHEFCFGRVASAWGSAVVEHSTPNGVTEIAQRLVGFPFTPPDVKFKRTMRSRASNDWFTKHDKNEIDELDSLDFYAQSGPQSVGVVPKAS